MHPLLYVLAIGTLLAALAFAIWNYASVRRHRATGGKASGIGGPNDPMAGSTENLRDPEVMRADLEDASARPTNQRARLRS